MGIVNFTNKTLYIRIPRTGSTEYCIRQRKIDNNNIVYPYGSHPRAVELVDFFNFDKLRSYGHIRNPWEWYRAIYNMGFDIGTYPPQEHDFSSWLRLTEVSQMWYLADDDGNILVDDVLLAEDEWAGRQETFHKQGAQEALDTKWVQEDVDFVAKRCAKEIEIGKYEFTA